MENRFMKRYFALLSLSLILLACRSSENESNFRKLGKDNNHKIDFYFFDSSYNKFLPDTNKVYTEIRSVMRRIRSYQKEADSLSESIQKENPSNDSLFVMANNFYIQHQYLLSRIILNSIKSNAQSTIDNLFLITMCVTTLPKNNDISERINILRSIPDKANNKSGKEKDLLRLEKMQEEIKVLNQEFSLNTNVFINGLNNDVYNLKDLLYNNRKYKIVVFGASWCRPCRIEERVLKYFYNKLDTSKFDIIHISLDNNFNKWRKYIHDDSFPWKSYILPNNFDSDLTQKLNIKGIPTNFLIDQEGKIILRNRDIRKMLAYLQ